MCERERESERDRASSCNLILMVCIDFIGGKDAGEMRMSLRMYSHLGKLSYYSWL